MPFIVTTKPPMGGLVDQPVQRSTRRAVARLGEARMVVLQQVGEGSALPNPTAPIDVPRSVARRQAARLSELGGTVVHPNGTRIEVERVSWTRLARDFAVPRGRSNAERAEILDAYNAAQKAVA